VRGSRHTSRHQHAQGEPQSPGEGLGHVQVTEVVDGHDEGPAVGHRSEVLHVQAAHPGTGGGPAQGKAEAHKAAALGDAHDPGSEPPFQRAVEGMAGVGGEQRELVPAVFADEPGNQAPAIGRVALTLAFRAMRIDPDVHRAADTEVARKVRRSSAAGIRPNCSPRSPSSGDVRARQKRRSRRGQRGPTAQPAGPR
jgi:hypothetical protein